jgi:hypothetical protein
MFTKNKQHIYEEEMEEAASGMARLCNTSVKPETMREVVDFRLYVENHGCKREKIEMEMLVNQWQWAYQELKAHKALNGEEK